MASSNKGKMQLGIFVALGVALFIAGIYFIGEKQQLFRSTFRLNGIFGDVGGLQVGNNVRFSGINVGTVEDIILVSDTTVRVEILVDERVRQFIKKNALASIGSEGLMGNKILIILPGTGGQEMITDNSRLETVPPINMDNILISFKNTMESVETITEDIAAVSKNIRSGKGTIGRLIMDKTWERDFDLTVANLKHGSEGMKVLMDAAQTSFVNNFDSTFVNLKEASVGFKEVMEKARSSWLLWGF